MESIKNILIIFNNRFYKEIDIDSLDIDNITIGNRDEYDIRLNMDLNEEFNIRLQRTNSYWELIEGVNTYCVINGIKATRKKLLHGDQVSVKFTENKYELFKINFFLDFTSGRENYDKVIYMEDREVISIGSDASNYIYIQDELVDRQHSEIKREKNGAYYINDLNSRYGVYINGKKVNGKTILNDNDFIIICGYKLLFVKNKLLTSNYNDRINVRELRVEIPSFARSALQYPEFIRNPRYIYNLPTDEIEIVTPPKRADKPGMQSFLALIPTLGMMGLMLSNPSMSGSGRSYYYVGMFGVTALSTMIMYGVERRRFRVETKKRKEMYLNYIDEQKNIIKDLYNEQIRISKILYPNNEETISIVSDFKPRLWEKNIEDEDFLNISLGYGRVPTTFSVKIPKEEWGQTEDDLILKPKEIKEEYSAVDKMPIEINLIEEKGMAILGDSEWVRNFVYNLLTQIAAYHYYEDVKIVFIYDKNEGENWQWIRWLPHVWSDDKNIRFMAEGKESAHLICGVLNDFMQKREEAANKSNSKGAKAKPHFLIFVTNPDLIDREYFSKYLEGRYSLGFTPIFLYKHMEHVPNNCSTIINIKEESRGEIMHVNNAEKVVEFNYEAIGKNDYEYFSRRMAPIYVKKSFSENSLPKMYTLFDLYGVNTSKELPILKNWKQNEVFKSMAAPLGVNISGEIVELNLHEKYHGPHGLVAGTTGSGKSEILQSLIISLAVQYHPHDINFILIDYKGGGMANLFKSLPHLVGTITNLDGNQINRSLIAIKSELKRRQRKFAENNVNHIDSYLKLYKEGKVSEPIPHLIMIADEFAELKSDQPDFMKELVSTARIGRSLGVHLILATQKPAGVVDNQIWSNSKFKLCLKVQDASDSKEVLKTDLAANIVEAGRAYFQVGNNEIFELFQSAWSGAKKVEDDDVSKNEIEISEVSIEGIRRAIYSSKEENKNKKVVTQLEETINTIKYLSERIGIERLDGPWLPPLEEIVYLDDLFAKYKNTIDRENITPIIGFYDDPEGQLQDVFKLDITEEGNALIIGAPGYGKTTLLQTILTSLMLTYTPKEVNIYILDFGTRVLKIFERAPQVGGVVLQEEEEKLENLLRFIKKEINKRKDVFANLGVGSLKAYKEATGKEMPHIVIMIDNYIALKEIYEKLEEDFIFIAREGSTIGVSLIITASNLGSLRYKLTSNFKNNLVLTCLDKAEYSNLFGSLKVVPSGIKGRIIFKDERVKEAQIALPVKKQSDLDRVKELTSIIEKLSVKITSRAKAIPYVPEVLYLNDILDYMKKEELEGSFNIPCGMSEREVEYRFLSLLEHPILTIIGQPKMGKSNFMRSAALSFINNRENSKIYAMDSKSLGLRQLRGVEGINYSIEKEEIQRGIKEIREALIERDNIIKEALLDSDNTRSEEEILEDHSNIAVLIDDIDSFVASCEKEELEFMASIISKYRNLKVSIIVCGAEDKFKNLVYSCEFAKKLKEEQCGLVFDSLNNQRFFDAQLRYGEKERSIEKGDAYLVIKNSFERIKTPLIK